MTKILVIEDEQQLIEEILDILQFEGFDTIGANNGREGVQLAQEHHPDLIICDITMPEMDGYEVLIAVREDPSLTQTPFIFVTARADKTFQRHGMELGADDYVTKPFTSAELFAAIRVRLERYEATQSTFSRELTEVKRQLTRLIAHELRTPLVSIRTVETLIERGIGSSSTEELKQLLDTLRSGSQRLNYAVEQVVFATQLDGEMLSRKTILESGIPMPLSSLLAGAIDRARDFTYRDPVASIHLDLSEREAMVQCDINALKHALAEPITNALNFSPQDGEVVISQQMTDSSVNISVVDQGPGFPQEQVDRVTEAFYQFNRKTQEQQGLGLGLNLAYRIIEAHDGTLTIDSAPGNGTKVTVQLPLTER